MNHEMKLLEDDYQKNHNEHKQLMNDIKLMKQTLEKIAQFENNYETRQPTYTLLQCCALAKDALSKVK